MLMALINPYLEKFLQLSNSESDSDVEEKILAFISELEIYTNYIKTGKTDEN